MQDDERVTMVQKAKFYVVWKGRKRGIFSSWEECAAQVQGFTGAQYKSFTSRLAAEQALRGKYAVHVGKPVSSGDWLFAPNPPVRIKMARTTSASFWRLSTRW